MGDLNKHMTTMFTTKLTYLVSIAITHALCATRHVNTCSMIVFVVADVSHYTLTEMSNCH